MNFTIVLASRERPTLLHGLVNSIDQTVLDKTNIEVIVGIDDDDQISHQKCKELETQYPYFKYFSQPRSEWLNRDYLNKAAEMGTGRYVIACNDDMEFRTMHWDKIMHDRLEDYLKDKPDGICMATTSDGIADHFGMAFSCFPLFTRQAINTLGFALIPEARTWVADIVCFNIYNAIGRVCSIPEVMLYHVAYHSKDELGNPVRERDATSYRVEQLGKIHFDCPQMQYVQKLVNKINNYNSLL